MVMYDQHKKQAEVQCTPLLALVLAHRKESEGSVLKH